MDLNEYLKSPIDASLLDVSRWQRRFLRKKLLDFMDQENLTIKSTAERFIEYPQHNKFLTECQREILDKRYRYYIAEDGELDPNACQFPISDRSIRRIRDKTDSILGTSKGRVAMIRDLLVSDGLVHPDQLNYEKNTYTPAYVLLDSISKFLIHYPERINFVDEQFLAFEEQSNTTQCIEAIFSRKELGIYSFNIRHYDVTDFRHYTELTQHSLAKGKRISESKYWVVMFSGLAVGFPIQSANAKAGMIQLFSQRGKYSDQNFEYKFALKISYFDEQAELSLLENIERSGAFISTHTKEVVESGRTIEFTNASNSRKIANHRYFVYYGDIANENDRFSGEMRLLGDAMERSLEEELIDLILNRTSGFDCTNLADNLDRIKTLIETGVDVNCVIASTGNRPLHIAADNCSEDLIVALGRSPDINFLVRNRDGDLPLDLLTRDISSNPHDPHIKKVYRYFKIRTYSQAREEGITKEVLRRAGGYLDDIVPPWEDPQPKN